MTQKRENYMVSSQKLISNYKIERKCKMSEAEDLMNKCCFSKCRGHALEAENKRLRKEIGDLRAAAVRKGLMRDGSFTGK